MGTNSNDNGPAAGQAKRITISLDPRLVIGLLLLVIIGMLAVWRPWADTRSTAESESRTVKVSGEATVKAEPDEFVFYPSYTIQNANRETALADMTKRSDEIIGKLKELGVSDAQIKTNADSFNREIMPYPYPEKPAESVPSYTLQLTITVGSRQQAQKIQDYLNTTSPTGTITPSASFSSAKRKELESKARDEATKDARAKADQSAKNLGFKVGDVKTVSDGAGFGSFPMSRGAVTMDAAAPEAVKLDVQPGQNELQYSVTVEYYVR